MKYCYHCGKQVVDNAVVCPQCGCQIDDLKQAPTETSTLGTLAIVFSILGGTLGFILAIVGLCTYRLPANKKKCKIALGICIAEVLIVVIVYVIIISAGASAVHGAYNTFALL